MATTKKKKGRKVQITFRLDEDALDVIRRYSEQENRSLNNQVDTVLKAFAEEIQPHLRS
jgi:hypothetical protein